MDRMGVVSGVVAGVPYSPIGNTVKSRSTSHFPQPSPSSTLSLPSPPSPPSPTPSSLGFFRYFFIFFIKISMSEDPGAGSQRRQQKHVSFTAFYPILRPFNPALCHLHPVLRPFHPVLCQLYSVNSLVVKLIPNPRHFGIILESMLRDLLPWGKDIACYELPQ